MTDRTIVQIEYGFRCSMRFLYPYLATPEGLSQWFADKVKANHEDFSFTWDGSSSEAKLTDAKPYKSVRFLMESGDSFEIKMREADISQDIIVTIIDSSEDTTADDVRRLWDSVIERLRGVIGA